MYTYPSMVAFTSEHIQRMGSELLLKMRTKIKLFFKKLNAELIYFKLMKIF